jgi:hypothetical protein
MLAGMWWRTVYRKTGCTAFSPLGPEPLRLTLRQPVVDQHGARCSHFIFVADFTPGLG